MSVTPRMSSRLGMVLRWLLSSMLGSTLASSFVPMSPLEVLAIFSSTTGLEEGGLEPQRFLTAGEAGWFGRR